MSGQGAERVSQPVYAGDVDPKEAYQALTQDKNAVFIDVRTQEERAFVGEPDLSTLSNPHLALPWRIYPTMGVNPNFTASLEAQVTDKNTPLYFMCKVGGRSADAAIAATEAGYSAAYNIAGGFEGDSNPAGQRGTINGWKASSLPWRQN